MRIHRNRRLYEKTRDLDRSNLISDFIQDAFDALYPIVKNYERLIGNERPDFLFEIIDIVIDHLIDTLDDEEYFNSSKKTI